MRDQLLDVIIDIIEEIATLDDAESSEYSISDALEQAGVHVGDIGMIVDWFERFNSSHFSRTEPFYATNKHVFRVFSSEECSHLTTESRGFLISMREAGFLKPEHIERIIDQCLAFNGRQVDVEHLKWISFMVLICQSEDPDLVALYEEWIMLESVQEATLH